MGLIDWLDDWLELDPRSCGQELNLSSAFGSADMWVWESPPIQAEEQSETLRRFLEQRPLPRSMRKRPTTE